MSRLHHARGALARVSMTWTVRSLALIASACSLQPDGSVPGEPQTEDADHGPRADPTWLAGADAGGTGLDAGIASVVSPVDAGPASGQSLGATGLDAGASGMVDDAAAKPTTAPGTTAGAQVSVNIDCSRAGLRALVDRYLQAMQAHDPSLLPAASTLKYTENGVLTDLGEGLWQTAGHLTFQRDALDTLTCSTATEAVFENQGAALLIGVRLRLDPQQLSEIELYHPAPLFSDAGIAALPALAGSQADDWQSCLPPTQRTTREQLREIADSYFESVSDPAVKPPFDMPCQQVLNGVGLSPEPKCSSLYVPLPLIPGLPVINSKATQRRYPVIDVEAGIAVGVAIVAETTLIFDMIKVAAGKIRAVDSVTGGTSSSSGWGQP